jgi:hypothetical protein
VELQLHMIIKHFVLILYITQSYKDYNCISVYEKKTDRHSDALQLYLRYNCTVSDGTFTEIRRKLFAPSTREGLDCSLVTGT